MTALPAPNAGLMLTADQVGRLFAVTGETVMRWARQGWVTCYRRGGGARFAEPEVRALYAWQPREAEVRALRDRRPA